MRVIAGLAAGWLILAMPALSRAQTGTPPDTAAAPATPAATAAVPPARASWVSDRLPLRVGDVLTVLVDEQTNAHEQVSQTASGQRSQDALLHAQLNGDDAVKPTRITSGLNGSSRDVGDARRLGDFTATMSVRVTEVGEGGVARIQGERSVTVDGRQQQITLTGYVRPEDVTSANSIYSSRIASAVIAYKGKKMAPRTGFIGKLLGMLWP